MRVRETSDRSAPLDLDRAASPPRPPSHSRAADGAPGTLDDLVAALPSNDEAARLFAQNARQAPSATDATSTAPSAPRMNDRVLYVGMNSEGGQSGQEERGLSIAVDPAKSHAETIVGYMGHVAVGHSERDASLGSDKVRVGGVAVDLATPQGAAAFASSLGLPPAQTSAIAKVLAGASDGTRDELAGIATVWAKAERGGDCPSRLVLSGHSGDGKTLYGEGASDAGNLSYASVHALAAAMPRAASFVEDVMLSACNSGFDAANGGTGLETWKKHFPNLRTAWGYGGKSGGLLAYKSPSQQQAVMHVGAWEKATRGRAERLDGEKAVRQYFDAARAQNPKVDKPQVPENVSVWTVRQGYVQGKG